MYKRVVIAIVASINVGCSSLTDLPDRSVDVKSELNALMQYFEPSVINNYDSKTTNADKKSYRDQVLAARIRAIDLNFNEFIKNISESPLIS